MMDETTPSRESQLCALMRERGLSLATAESCSGGLIAHWITCVSGSSAYYLGGVVSYGNKAKMTFLGVKRETLEAEGAVSEEVAREMAEGARERFKSTVAVSTTGIAGPTGGTEEKPVGLVYFARATEDGTRVDRKQFSGDRESVKEQTADHALSMILDYLK